MRPFSLEAVCNESESELLVIVVDQERASRENGSKVVSHNSQI